MPKHHTICDELKEDGPGFAGPPGFTSNGYFKRRVYKITGDIFERKE